MNDNHLLSRTSTYRNRRRRTLRAIIVTVIFLVLGFGIYTALAHTALNDRTPADQGADVNGKEPGSNTGGDTKLPNDTEPGAEEGDATNPSKADEPGQHGQQTDSDQTIEDDPAGSNGHSQHDSVSDPDAQVTFNFVGDVLLGSTVNFYLDKHGYDYPYTHVKDLLQAADFTMANLETPITDRGVPADKQWTYQSDPKVLPAFKEAGFDIVNLANNHVLDYGLDGLINTFRHLQDEGIQYVGAGENIDEAMAPVIVEKNGIRIAVLGFSRVVPEGSWKADENKPGVAPTYNYTRPVAAIQAAKEEADLVVVMVHWGEERKDLPNDVQTDLGHRYIDAGADLVIGSHPHVVQGFEYYNGKWIAYSLGNFIFTTNADHKLTWETVVLQATCGKQGDCDLQLTPIFTYAAQPTLMEAEQAAAMIARINRNSFGAAIAADGKINADTVPQD